MDDKEKPALEKAADKVNDAVEEIALKAADAAIEPDPEHVAATSNEQLYLPEASRRREPNDQLSKAAQKNNAKK